MMINRTIPSVDYNRMDTQLNESTDQNSLKVPKVVKLTNNKTLNLKMEASVINSPMSFPPLILHLFLVWPMKHLVYK